MTPHKPLLMICLVAALSTSGRAQFGGSGGMAGFGGNGGSAALGDGSGVSQGSTKAKWRPWISVGGSYVDNPIYLNEQGDVVTGTDTRGLGGGWGLSVSKSIERTVIQATYSGSLTTGPKTNGIRGVSQVLTFRASHRFNRNFYGSVQQMLGSTLGGYGTGSGFAGMGSSLWGFNSQQLGNMNGLPGLGDPALNGFVDEEVFANRVKFSGTFGSLGYRLTMRSSLSVSGGAQFTRRSQATLSDADSYFTNASYSYALDQKTQLGAGYSWGTFKYPNMFGDNIVQSAGLSIGRRLTDHASISGNAGMTQFSSNFIGLIPVDPEIGAALGISSTAVTQKARRATFAGGLAANYSSDIASVFFVAQRGMVPGNGVTLSGVRDLVATGVSRSFFSSRLSTGLNASASRISGVLQSNVAFRYQAALHLGYNLGAGIFLSAGGGLRWQRMTQTGPYLPQKFATVGLGWSPGGYPLFF